MASIRVADDLYFNIHGQILEILRQLRQRTAIKGNLVNRHGQRFQNGKVDVESSKLFEVIGTVTILATTKPFVVADKFVRNIEPVKISFLGSNFQEWFGDKTEEPVAETTLRYAKLMRPSLDGLILAELGDKAETKLTQIYALMGRQPNGEKGVLFTNRWANIFYVDGRTVGVRWLGDGWFVGADSVGSPRRWHGECRVFSRNS